MPRIIFHNGQMHIVPDDAPQSQTDGVLEMKHDNRRGIWHWEHDLLTEIVPQLENIRKTNESFNTNSSVDTENT